MSKGRNMRPTESNERQEESDDDFLPTPIQIQKRKKQLSTPKKDGKESIGSSSKKAKTISNVITSSTSREVPKEPSPEFKEKLAQHKARDNSEASSNSLYVDIELEELSDHISISEADMESFHEAYSSMDPDQMWTLRSDRKVEQIIYEFGRNLYEESYLHSFIINDADATTKKLFSKEEWEEITSSRIKPKPKLERSQLDLLRKYTLDNTNNLRKVLAEPFVSKFDRSIHFDLDFINYAYRSMLFLWEREGDPFAESQLEGWYEMNVWGHLIDPLFHNLEVELKRGEGMSLASSDRKNNERSVDGRKKARKIIGRKGDGIFRSCKSRLEFGGIEAGRKWEGKSGDKYLTDSLKLCKMLRDMMVQLFIECDMIEDYARKLQVVGILQGANRIQVIRMDLPKGYVYRIQRENVYEVAGQLNKSQPLAFVLKEILCAKYVIKQTLNVINEKKEADLEKLFNDSEQNIPRTPPRTIVATKAFKTPTSKRTKDVINKKSK